MRTTRERRKMGLSLDLGLGLERLSVTLFSLLCFLALSAILPIEAKTSPKSFEANVQIQADNGPPLSAAVTYSATAKKELWIYTLPTFANMTVLTDYTEQEEWTVCALACSASAITRIQKQFWVDDQIVTALPGTQTINGVEVQTWTWIQSGTSTLITFYATSNLSRVVRVTFMSSDSYVVVDFWSFKSISVNGDTFALPQQCSSCSFKYDFILALNIPSADLNGDDGSAYTPGSMLVKSIGNAIASSLLGSFSSGVRISVINFQKHAIQRLEFSNNLAAITESINNGTERIKYVGDPFELCRWYFKRASPNDAAQEVVYVTQGSFTNPDVKAQQIANLKKTGAVIYAITIDPSYSVSTIASFPTYAYIADDDSDVPAVASDLASSLCITGPGAACNCHNNETCACGVCLCQYPWMNDYEHGITDCSICPRTSENFCFGNGVVNADCKTCTCTKPCQNGGIWDPLTCECLCAPPFSNNPPLGVTDCTYCADYNCIDCPCDSEPPSCDDETCSGNGVILPNCSCSCYPPWMNSGPITNCSVCSRTGAEFCNGLGTVGSDCNSCTCSLFDCQTGGVLSDYCSCDCPSPWSPNPDLGILNCTYCSLLDEGCPTGLTLDEESCSCSCDDSIICEHGVLDVSTCSCNCDPNWEVSPSGSCSVCTLDPAIVCTGRGSIIDCATCECFANSTCVHGNQLDNCECACESPWINDEAVGIFNCSLCGLSPSSCHGSSTLDVTECHCVCPLTESDCSASGLVLNEDDCTCVPPPSPSISESHSWSPSAQPSKTPSHSRTAPAASSASTSIPSSRSPGSTTTKHPSTSRSKSRPSFPDTPTPTPRPHSPSLTPPTTHTPTHTSRHSSSPKPKPKSSDGNTELKLGLGLGIGLGGAAALVLVGGAAVFMVFSGAVAASLPPPPSFSPPPPPPQSVQPESYSAPSSAQSSLTTDSVQNTPPDSVVPKESSPQDYLSRTNPLFDLPEVLCDT